MHHLHLIVIFLLCLCRSGSGQRSGGRLPADVCGLQREVWRPEEPQTAAHCTAIHLHLTTSSVSTIPSPVLPHQPPALAPSYRDFSQLSSGMERCMLGHRTGTLRHFGAESSGTLKPQWASLPSPPTERLGPFEPNDRSWTQKGGKGGDGAGATPPLPPPKIKNKIK